MFLILHNKFLDTARIIVRNAFRVFLAPLEIRACALLGAANERATRESENSATHQGQPNSE
jgi:hypothetical protein